MMSNISHPTPPRSAWITWKIITLAPGSDGDSAKGLASLFSRSLGQILQGKCVIEDRNDARHGFHGFGCKTRTSQRPRRTDHATTLRSSGLRSDSTLPYRLKGGLNPSGPMPTPSHACLNDSLSSREREREKERQEENEITKKAAFPGT